MSHGLIWLPLLVIFPLITALGWLERRRQNLFRAWAEGAELSKLDDGGGARLIDGTIAWCVFESGKLNEKGCFEVKGLDQVDLLALGSGEAPLTEEAQGACRLRLMGNGQQADVPFADAERARRWRDQLMSRSRCEL
jgi:hypothetical protein